MISGPVMIQALEGEGAIAKNRELMGATDPKKADKGTIRADFADSIDANAVHGSDAPETAAVEVAFFFPGMNVYSAAERRGRHATPLTMPVNLLDFDLDGLAAFCGAGRKALSRRPAVPLDPPEGRGRLRRMSDLAKSLRDKLAGLCRGAAPAGDQRTCQSADGTVKWLFDVGAGNAVETVFIPEDDRGTLCVSSQAGCAVGCRFCSAPATRVSAATSAPARSWPSCGMPSTSLRRRLGLAAGDACHRQRGDDGHGRAAAELRRAGAGAAHDARRPRLRPVAPPRHGVHLGHGAMIDRLREDCPVALAVSLHAPNDALRDALVPLNRKHGPGRCCTPACAIWRRAARLHHLRVLHARRRQRQPGSGAGRLVQRLVRGRVPCKFNLIPFNPFPAVGPEALAARTGAGLCACAAGRRHRHHHPQDPGRRHRRRLRPAGRRGAGPHPCSERLARGGTGDPDPPAASATASAARMEWPLHARAGQLDRPGSLFLLAACTTTHHHQRPPEARDARAAPNPTSPTPSGGRGAAGTGGLYFQRGQADTALDESQAALAAKPDLAEAFNLRGLIWPAWGPERWPRELPACAATGAA
jgi:23S rRNA (adenine2503-C2)-methyltransferase